MYRYLITGVAGFIGSSLARELVAQGESVRGIDNFLTGKKENLKDFAEKIDFRETSILDEAALSDACKDVDFILHEAALPSVPRSIADPLETHLHNVTGTLNVLTAARKAGVKRIVYAASSSAYGDTPTLPKREDMAPKPISPYGVSKLAAEHYMQAFHRTYGMETVCLRYFNIFGPGQDAQSEYSAVLAKFITQMLKGEMPTIYGNGEQTRDFNFIDNCVSANLLACRANTAKVSGKVFNVAGGKQISLNETFKILKQIIGFTGEVNYQPERKGDIKHSLADISQISEAMGYAPNVDFVEGLKRTVDWYKKQ